MSWTRALRRSSQPLAASKLGHSRSDAATRRRRLFLEPLEKRSLLAAIGNGLSAAPDYYSLDEDTTLNVSAPGVLGNDAGTSAVLVASPANGAVSFFSDGSFTYTPLADWYGTDSFTYQALDGELISDEITVTLTVNDVAEPPPPAPVADDDSYSTDEDTPLTIGGAGVLDNDQGQSITAAVTSGPSNGSVTMNPDGSFTYTPNADFNGSDSFAYTVTDSANQTDDAQVTITVNSVNDPPVAIDVGFSAYEDQQLMVYSSMGNGLLYGASDPDNDWNLTPQLVSQASNGYVDFSYYGSFIYTPAAEFSGTDTFTYQISDGNGGYSNVATVTIQVDPVNDAPVAVEDYFTLAEDDYTFSGNLLTNDSDIDSPTFSPTLASGVSNGNLIVQMDGSFVYNPYANFFGTDSFTYYVSDGLAQSNTVTVWLTITEVNDAPIGVADSYTVNEDSNIGMSSSSGVLGNDFDVETSSMYLTATLITGPTNGTFMWIDSLGGFSYTPNQDFYGEDTFTYQASDGQLLSEITTVTITVSPINDTPVAADQSYTLDEDTPLTITDPNLSLLAGASDVDGDTLSVAIYNSPQFGQITSYDPSTGAFTYVPNENYFGNDYFTYLVSDGSASAFANVNLTVNSVNDPPQVTGESYTLNEDEPLTAGSLLANDSDIEGDALSISLFNPPEHGEVTIDSSGGFTYAPETNYNGLDAFTYVVADGGTQILGTVSLTVTPVNDAPVAVFDGNPETEWTWEHPYWTTNDEELEASLSVLANDFDVDGDDLTVSIEDAPIYGNVILNADGSFLYTADPMHIGVDYFTYRAFDGIEQSAPAVVYIAVNAINVEWFAGGEWKRQIVIPAIWAGESVSMRSVIEGPGAGLARRLWSITGVPMAEWKPDDHSGIAKPISDEAKVAEKVDFYWVDGGGRREASILVSIAGRVEKKTFIFTVHKPTNTVTSTTSDIYTYANDDFYTYVQFGNEGQAVRIFEHIGIIFNRAGALPEAAGDFTWVQLIDTTMRWQVDVDGTVRPKRRITNGFVLDAPYPYSDDDNTTNDNPRSRLHTGMTEHSRHDEFKMYLMWKSNKAGSTPVPICVTAWSWGFAGVRGAGNSWTVTPDAFPVDPPSAAINSYPVWTSNFEDYPDEWDD